MLISLQNLTREDRIKRLIEENMNKSVGLNVSLLNPNDFTIVAGAVEEFGHGELHTLFSQIEDRIYYITQAPAFEFGGSTRRSETIKFDDIDHIVKYINETPNKFLIFYSISPLTLNEQQFIMVRGVFIDDPIYLRNEKIDEILN